MVERTPDQGPFWARERDRLATELRYVTRHHDWDPPPEIIDAIVDWQIETIAAARADVWIPGMAGSRDPVVEEVLNRYYAHHIGTAVARLIEENTGLRRQLLQAVACIRSCAMEKADGGARARAVLEQLLIEPRAAEAGVIPKFLAARPEQTSRM
jgi:hypothetical protein